MINKITMIMMIKSFALMTEMITIINDVYTHYNNLKR